MEEKFYLCKQNQEGMKEDQKIVIYQTEDGQTQIDVWLENDTVWLTRQQLATLFGRDYKTISKHINNGLLEGTVNKAKAIKRSMYNRANADVLRAKMVFGGMKWDWNYHLNS